MISASQVVVSGTLPVPLVTVPPGECRVSLWNVGTAAVTFGPGTPGTASGAVLPASGTALPVVPVTISSYPGSRSTPLYGFCAGTSTVNVLVVTDS